MLTHRSAFSRFLPDSFTVTVGAARDIEPGEEVTISCRTTQKLIQNLRGHWYDTNSRLPTDLMVGQTYEKRQKALKRWEFTCKCALCSAPEAERNASDARRIEIEKKRDQVMDAFRAGDANKAIRLTEDIIRLARLEGLTPFFSEQYDNLGRIYWAIGQRQESERYARMSLRVLREQGFVPEDQDEEYQVRLLLKSYAEEV